MPCQAYNPQFFHTHAAQRPGFASVLQIWEQRPKR